MTTWTEEEVYLIASLAHEIAMQGRHAEALVLFEGLAAAAPGHLYARRAVAALRLRLGHPSEALAAIAAPSADGPTGRLRLECLLELGRRADAGREFEAIRGRLEPGERERYALLLGSAPAALPRPT